MRSRGPSLGQVVGRTGVNTPSPVAGPEPTVRPQSPPSSCGHRRIPRAPITRTRSNTMNNSASATLPQPTATNDLGTLAEDARALLQAPADVTGGKITEARNRLASALDSGKRMIGQA